MRLRALAAAAVAALSIAAPAAAENRAPLQPGPLTLPDGATHVQRGEGWVQRDPRVYVIAWGPAWVNDTSGVLAAEQQLFRELPGSAYNAILGQYGVVNDVRYGGTYVDTDRPPRFIKPYTLGLEARKVRRRMPWADTRYAQWVILPEPGTNMSYFTGECGEHDDLHLLHDRRPWYVDLIPSFTSPQFRGCIYDYSGNDGEPTSAGPLGSLVAATTSLTTHEYAEAATDPWASTGVGYGWATSDGNTNEIADLCAWYSGVPAGMTQNVTYLYSDAARACVL